MCAHACVCACVCVCVHVCVCMCVSMCVCLSVHVLEISIPQCHLFQNAIGIPRLKLCLPISLNKLATDNNGWSVHLIQLAFTCEYIHTIHTCNQYAYTYTIAGTEFK